MAPLSLSKRIFTVDGPRLHLFTVFPVHVGKTSEPAIFHRFMRPLCSWATHPSICNLLWQKISCSKSGLVLWVVSCSSDDVPQNFSSCHLMDLILCSTKLIQCYRLYHAVVGWSNRFPLSSHFYPESANRRMHKDIVAGSQPQMACICQRRNGPFFKRCQVKKWEVQR